MPLNINDFTEGLDPSVLAQISGAQLLQLIRAAKPSSDRGLNISSDEQPDVVTYPYLATYTWYKPSENNKISRRYNPDTSTWETGDIGNLSVDTDQLVDGAVTLEKLFSPDDVTKAFYLLRVNATGEGWELFQFAIEDNSITLAKLFKGVGNNNKLIKIAADNSGWEYITADDVIDLVSDQKVVLSKLNPQGVIGGIVISDSTGSAIGFLPPGTPGYVLRSALTGPYWAPETTQVITKGFTSGEEVINAGFNTITIAHGLGVTPKTVRAVFVCKTIDVGYAVGDEVDLHSVMVSSGGIIYPMACCADTTNIVVPISASALVLWNKALDATSALTRASWRLKVYATA